MWHSSSQNVTISSFLQYKHLQRHEFHTGERPFHCTKCKHIFSVKTQERECIFIFIAPYSSVPMWQRLSKFRWLEETWKHIGKMPFQCPECDNGFLQSKYLQRLERFHAGEKPFNCTKCKNRCSDFRNLKTQERSHSSAQNVTWASYNPSTSCRDMSCSTQ